MNQERREFLKNSGLVTGAVCCGGVVMLSGCKSLETIPYVEKEGKMMVAKSDFGEKRFAIIKVKGLGDPIYISQNNQGDYHAVLMRCTHKNCRLKPVGRALECGCHGSVFDRDGMVLEGPAKDPLRKFKVEEDESNVYIS